MRVSQRVVNHSLSLSGVIFLAAIVGACTAAVPDQPTLTPTHAIATRSAPSDPESASTALPTVTPIFTATPIFESGDTAAVAPTPLPDDERNYELCVAIASDSNGYGHVSFQRPDTGEAAIVYITPLSVPLQAHLNAQGLNYLTVIDRSLSAGGLTIASSNYLESDQYFRLKQDQCKFVIVTPFYPDVAVNLSGPQDYLKNMNWLLDGLSRSSPGSLVLILNFYQTARAEFTANNSGRGLYPERIDAFNEALANACAPGGLLAAYSQVTCIDIQPYFYDMGTSHVLGETTLQAYQAALYRETSYTPTLDDFFANHPDGVIIGDGIHLSLAGRDRLAERLAGVIFELNDDF